MTIDEAIEKLRSDAIIDKYNMCGYSMKQHEQIAEWLEELKVLRLQNHLGRDEALIAGRKEGYNKAINDYMNKLCDHCMQQTNECYKLECPFCTDGCDIINIAEQLKEGVLND